MQMGSSIFSKIWGAHVLGTESGRDLLYVDRHLTHEVTSPIAFESLQRAGRKVRRPDLTFAFMDHNVPTGDRSLPIRDEMSAAQIATLRRNSEANGLTLFDYYSPFQGIVHVVGPEMGLTLPGIILACGDSHTSTHGALGAVAVGIGTSEGEHVLATQTLWMKRPKEMLALVRGSPNRGVTAKDVVLSVIRRLGIGGAIGHCVEFAGETVRSFSMEERMTLTNMTIEAGARTAIMSPDDKTFEYIKGTPYAPSGRDWAEAVAIWSQLPSDPDSKYDAVSEFEVSGLEPQVTWGTNPSMTIGISESVPSPADVDGKERSAVERAIKYMGLQPGTKATEIGIDKVFIGSCTNARISDLIEAARVVSGRHVHEGVRAMVVPGSQLVKRKAERLGLHRVFLEAGFEWRNSGCSMCIAMNEDRLADGERCASTSNRNFENRQGVGGRTHLVSPMMAAAAAIEGHFVDTRELELADLTRVTTA
jgi:3-isopropylmalate/(R)-2-methylmalate dehydratase large subunit